MADDVAADGGQHVLDMGFGKPAAAAVAQAMGVGGFGDGRLASSADGAPLLPLRGLLPGAELGLDLLRVFGVFGEQGETTARSLGVAGAGQPAGAGAAGFAGFAGKQDQQAGAGVSGGRLPWWAGDSAWAGQGGPAS